MNAGIPMRFKNKIIFHICLFLQPTFSFIPPWLIFSGIFHAHERGLKSSGQETWKEIIETRTDEYDRLAPLPKKKKNSALDERGPI